METSQEKVAGVRGTAHAKEEVSRRNPPPRPKTPASLEHGPCGGEMGQPGQAGRDLAPRAMGSHGRQEQRQIHCLLLISPSPGQWAGITWPLLANGGQMCPFPG